MIKFTFERMLCVSMLSFMLAACGGGSDDDRDMPVTTTPMAVTEETPVSDGMAFAETAVRGNSVETEEPRPVAQAQLPESDTVEPEEI